MPMIRLGGAVVVGSVAERPFFLVGEIERPVPVPVPVSVSVSLRRGGMVPYCVHWRTKN